jgi:LysM repeat protein
MAALLAVVGAIVMVVEKPPQSVPTNSGKAVRKPVRKLPPYWTVHPGENLTTIARKTGLSVTTLEGYNPAIDPQSLVPGERLNLWQHPPTHHAKPKPLGPRVWTVRPGESYGSIAAKTRIGIVKLENLNPQLKPSALQPGDRVRLR